MVFVTQIKKFTYDFRDICLNDITEFEQVFDNLDAEYNEGVKTIKGLKITNRSLVKDVEFLISDSIANDVFTLAVNHTCMENDKRMPVDSKENTNCVRENGECLELEAEIAKTKKLLSESAQRCSQLEQHYVDLELKFQKYKECFENPSPTVGDCVRQALETEITQLKDRITSLNIQLNAYKIENKSLSQKYEELAKSNMFSRAELTGRITALTSENANMKAGIKGKQISEPKKSKKP
nr:hypothetical protein [Tanacetum cinerariifolium]